MFKKDRYSHAIIIAVVFIVIGLFFFSKGKNKIGNVSGTIGLIGVAYFFSLFLASGRVNGSIPKEADLKDEKGCGFNSNNPKRIDGIQYDGKRYKVVNGADVYFDKNNTLQPCGFGSAFMQKLGRGGLEPKSIQSDPCWKID